MRWALSIIGCWSVVLAACGPTTDDTLPNGNATPSLVTTSSEVATTSPSASVTSSSSTTTRPTAAPSVLDDVVFLVAGPEGVSLNSPTGVQPILADRWVRVAFPDRQGGVVFQGWQGGIWWMPSLNHEPVEVVAVGDLQNATSLKSRPVALYTVGVECTSEELFDEECYRSSLWLRYLDGDEDRVLFEFWTFDGGLISASSGGGTVAASMMGSSDQGGMRFFTVDGAPLDVPHPPPAEPLGMGDCWVADLSPDGSVLAYSDTAGLCAQAPFDVAVLDLISGEELLRFDLGTGGYPFPGATVLDFDGAKVFVMQRGVPPMMVANDGSQQEITWLPEWLWKLEQVDHPDQCSTWAFGNGGGQVFCHPPGTAVLWDAG